MRLVRHEGPRKPSFSDYVRQVCEHEHLDYIVTSSERGGKERPRWAVLSQRLGQVDLVVLAQRIDIVPNAGFLEASYAFLAEYFPKIPLALEDTPLGKVRAELERIEHNPMNLSYENLAFLDRPCLTLSSVPFDVAGGEKSLAKLLRILSLKK